MASSSRTNTTVWRFSVEDSTEELCSWECDCKGNMCLQWLGHCACCFKLWNKSICLYHAFKKWALTSYFTVHYKIYNSVWPLFAEGHITITNGVIKNVYCICDDMCLLQDLPSLHILYIHTSSVQRNRFPLVTLMFLSMRASPKKVVFRCADWHASPLLLYIHKHTLHGCLCVQRVKSHVIRLYVWKLTNYIHFVSTYVRAFFPSSTS